MGDRESEYSSRLFDRAIWALMRLPGVGRRWAHRFALHMLSRSEEERWAFTEALRQCFLGMQYCPRCHGFSDDGLACERCRDPRRDGRLLCVVEDARGVLALGRRDLYGGQFFVLGGLIDPMEGVGPEDLPIDALLARAGDGVEEVILALSPTMEGETTSFYLRRKLDPLGLRLSELARGIGYGESLEQIDDQTLAGALADRRELARL